MSPAQRKLEAGEENEGWIILSSEETSWIGSLTPAGAVIGPVLVGLLADRIGRKRTLLFTACPALVSWIMLIFVKTVVLIYIARFILGIAVGMVYAVSPMYVGEISEVSPQPFAKALQYQYFILVLLKNSFVMNLLQLLANAHQISTSE
jgi:SP family facilitated glucose transporter-like MFS transporter 8